MSTWPFPPPLATMEAKVTERWPEGEFAYEPKWDGFRAVSWHGLELRLDSRNQRPLLRYFPELVSGLEQLPQGTVVDGEVVVVIDDVTSFDHLGLRIHPAESRIKKLSAEYPAQLVGFDLLALEGVDLRYQSLADRRAQLETLFGGLSHPWNLTPSTTDLELAQQWFIQFEPAGCDGIIAKPLTQSYQEGKRGVYKIKHRRTVDCVVGGYREHKQGGKVGSLLLGLFNEAGDLHFIGHCSGFSDQNRSAILEQLQTLPPTESFGGEARVPGGQSRWSAGKDLSWVPVDPVLVVEVSYDQLENNRFRHATRFHRWRIDKLAEECGMDQLERPTGTGFSEVVEAPV